jgi:hypothetical protein
MNMGIAILIDKDDKKQTLNQRVAGSIPASPTIQSYGLGFFLLARD